MKSAIGTAALSKEVVVTAVTDAGNGLSYLEDADGHQYSCLPDGTMGWSGTVRPNGAYQQWMLSGATAACCPDGKTNWKTSYSVAVPNA